MIRAITLALSAAVIALGLSGCDPFFRMKGVEIAAVATPAALSADQVAALYAGCQKAGPALLVASALTMPPVLRETAEGAAAFCAEIGRGQLPATADGNSVSWLDRIVSILPAVARAAGIILPLVL